MSTETQEQQVLTEEIISNYLNQPEVKANLIQLALSLHHASRGKWITPQEVHKKSEYRGNFSEFKTMVDLLIMAQLAFSKVERSGDLKIKITLNKDTRKATLIQQISQMETTLTILKDELNFIQESETQEA